MYSSEDLERFYLDYQSDWLPRGMSMQAYCSCNNVPYKVMDGFVRQVGKKIVEVRVEGHPEEQPQKQEAATQTPVKLVRESKERNDNRISVTIRFGNGTEVSRRGLDYPGLRVFIEKLEVLC